MGTTIGELFPLAVTLALGPLSIIAIVLILVSGDAGAKGIGFAFGRIAGLSLIIALTLVVFSLIGDPALGHRGHPKPAVSYVRILIGLLLVGYGVRLWLKRNEPDKPSPIAKKVDGLTASSAVGLGLLVSAVDPASISLGLLVGVDIAGARQSIAGDVAIAAVFVLVSTLSVTVPLLIYLVGGQAAERKLAGIKDWLTSNEKAVMMVLAIVIGAMLIGRGIRDLTGI